MTVNIGLSLPESHTSVQCIGGFPMGVAGEVDGSGPHDLGSLDRMHYQLSSDPLTPFGVADHQIIDPPADIG